VALAVSVLLFAAVLTLTILHERDAALLLFYSVPIAVLALEFGLVSGIAGGTVAAALFVADVLYEGHSFDLGGWALRPAAFLTLGLVVGYLAQLRRRESEARARLARERGELVARILSAEEGARREVAQSLHDDVLQSLMVANHDLIEASPGRKQVGEAQEVVRGAIERVREAALALHPVTLAHGGLEPAIAAIAREAANRGGFEATVTIDPDAVEASDRDELVVSVARELLANTAQHSGASEVSVSLAREGEAIALEVADDGAGLAPGRRATIAAACSISRSARFSSRTD
jgi:signal transduction histidine kinase